MKKISPTYIRLAILLLVLSGNLLLKTLELLEYSASGKALTFYFSLSPYLSEPWKLLLPFHIGDNFYRWSTTGLVISSIPQLFSNILGPYITLYVFNAFLIVTTFVTSWYLFKSTIFAFTMTLCMAFGTQFNGLFGNYSIVIYYLLIAYIEINILFLVLILRGRENTKILNIGFTISLILAALCWETWIDYAVFLLFLFIILYVIFRKKGNAEGLKKTKALFAVLISIVIVYLAVKVTYSTGVSEHFTHGKEGEVVFSYILDDPKYGMIAVEDVLSNVLTLNFIALSNYLPSFLLSSNSLTLLGQDVVTLQYNYHKDLSHLTYYHHLFYWYFLAGVGFVIFLYFFVRYLKSSLSKPCSRDDIFIFAALLLILTGSFSHMFIKFRPYMSVPLLSYKCIISILGVSYLISLLLLKLHQSGGKRMYIAIACLSWFLIVFGGFTRNATLSHLGSLVMPGSNYAHIPEPLRHSPIKNFEKAMLYYQKYQ